MCSKCALCMCYHGRIAFKPYVMHISCIKAILKHHITNSQRYFMCMCTFVAVVRPSTGGVTTHTGTGSKIVYHSFYRMLALFMKSLCTL